MGPAIFCGHSLQEGEGGLLTNFTTFAVSLDGARPEYNNLPTGVHGGGQLWTISPEYQMDLKDGFHTI